MLFHTASKLLDLAGDIVDQLVFTAASVVRGLITGGKS